MSGIPAVVVSAVTLIVVTLAALGVGSSSRLIGYHLPWVSTTSRTWVASHRAALFVVGPTSAAALLLNVSALDPFAEIPSSAAWILWSIGVVVGAVIAVVRARAVLEKIPAPTER